MISDAVLIALIGGLPATIVAGGAVYVSYLNGRKQDVTAAKVDTIDTKVDDVKKATDGMLHAATTAAEQKGRAEGAAIATAGAAAASPTAAK